MDSPSFDFLRHARGKLIKLAREPMHVIEYFEKEFERKIHTQLS
jgi:hypothetical protein